MKQTDWNSLILLFERKDCPLVAKTVKDQFRLEVELNALSKNHCNFQSLFMHTHAVGVAVDGEVGGGEHEQKQSGLILVSS